MYKTQHCFPGCLHLPSRVIITTGYVITKRTIVQNQIVECLLFSTTSPLISFVVLLPNILLEIDNNVIE